MLLLLCESSLSWSVQPSNQFGGHPVFGLTKVYVPIGHSTDAVKEEKVIEEWNFYCYSSVYFLEKYASSG